ncbi:MAG TPA: nuclear transport factor 2 family protein [Candidatus Acidoferrales bacterium]|nr:nuclear transport factor 2 family protein [Candidatus Acidoferrales bacterium]
MNRILVAALVVIGAGAIALGQAKPGAMGRQKASRTGAARAGSVTAELTSAEHAWIDADIAGDTEKVGAVLGDDWVGIGPDGQSQTRAQYLAEVKNGKNKLDSFEMGPLAVRAYGGTAVVRGSDTEKSSYAGRDTSGKYVWTDVFVKRNGEWKAVSSQITKLSGAAGGF